MVAPTLRVLLAEKGYTEAGSTLRSICAEAGRSLEIVFVESRAELEQALPAHCPDVALVQLAVLQPDAPAYLAVLHLSHPSVPFILFADPADKACAVTCLSMGAKDFVLEGFMDERTMARALRSAWGGQPLETVETLYRGLASSPETNPAPPLSSLLLFCSASTPKQDYAFSVSLANSKLLEVQVGSEAAGQILQEIMRVLRASVRPKDLLVPVSLGKWILHFTGIGETAGKVILQRVRSRITACTTSFLPSSRLMFTFAAENCGMEAKPVLPHCSSTETGPLGSPVLSTEP